MALGPQQPNQSPSPDYYSKNGWSLAGKVFVVVGPLTLQLFIGAWIIAEWKGSVTVRIDRLTDSIQSVEASLKRSYEVDKELGSSINGLSRKVDKLSYEMDSIKEEVDE